MKKIVHFIGLCCLIGFAVNSSRTFSQGVILDLTFSGDGIVTTSIGASDEEAYSVVIQPDGKIIASNLRGQALSKKLAEVLK